MRGRIVLGVLFVAACMAADIEAVASAWGRRDTGAIAYRSQMFGIGWGPHGLVLGWSREDGVRAPANCMPKS